jgi:hypothetical protein
VLDTHCGVEPPDPATSGTRGLTSMADAGVPVHTLRKSAGHGSLSTTQRYLHSSHDAVLEAGELLTNYLHGSQGGPNLRAV